MRRGLVKHAGFQRVVLSPGTIGLCCLFTSELEVVHPTDFEVPMNKFAAALIGALLALSASAQTAPAPGTAPAALSMEKSMVKARKKEAHFKKKAHKAGVHSEKTQKQVEKKI